MPAREPRCPKCEGAMEEGYVADYAHGAIRQSEWVDGEPERSFWTGLKVKGHAQVPVTALRCSLCGFLEFYAR